MTIVFLMIRRPPRSTHCISSAASDVYKRQVLEHKKGSKIVAPCPHQGKCPLAKGKQWCHFDQPTGMYPKRIFGTLPTDQAIQLEKFSYLVIKKDNSLTEE